MEDRKVKGTRGDPIHNYYQAHRFDLTLLPCSTYSTVYEE